MSDAGLDAGPAARLAYGRVHSPFPHSPLPALLSRFHTLAYTALRVMAALVLMQHGLQKLFGAFAPPGHAAPGGAATFSLMWFVGILETFGGASVALGLLTRPIAFLLAGEMAVAFFWKHFPNSVFPIVNRGEPAVLLCFIFLLLVAGGAGPWSLDAKLGRDGDVR